MKKAFISFAVILLGVAGTAYYHFLFDGRVLLKNETGRIVNLLSGTGIGKEFSLSEVCTPADSVFVVEPYASDFFKTNSHLQLMSGIKRSIERQTMYDGYCQLLFVKGNKVVSYADISRSDADFCGLDTCNLHHPNPKFPAAATLYLDEQKKAHLK